MLKTILLLTPVYVTLFWVIMLNADYYRNYHVASRFLGKFMMAAFMVYFSHFLFFSGSSWYAYIDPVYQYASLLVYPMFYIYVRLLTVDTHFSFRLHGKYLLPATVLFVLYTLAVLWCPVGCLYKTIVIWLMKIIFLLQVIFSVYANYKLLKQYGGCAKQFYSDMADSRVDNIKLLNYVILVIAIASFTLGALGRDPFTHHIVGLVLASFVFSVSLFLIGWIGYRQNLINPTFEPMGSLEKKQISEVPANAEILNENKTNEALLDSFICDKQLFLNKDLTINDLALSVGTNRTTLSNYINKTLNQNFCSYINGFRVEYLQKTIVSHPDYTLSQLAEACGFGSVDSMKRAVMLKTGLSMVEWRRQQVQSEE